MTQISMSDEDDGIVQNNCCQRKFCKYFLLLEELRKVFCCWRNCARSCNRRNCANLGEGGRAEDASLYLCFLGASECWEIRNCPQLSFLLPLPTTREPKKTETIGESRCGLLRMEVWLMAGTMGIMWWQVLVTKYAEVDNSHYLDPRTAVVATIDHIKQVGYSQTCSSLQRRDNQPISCDREKDMCWIL